MAKLENKSKDNPRLEQRLLADGRISLYLVFYLGRDSFPILDEFGEPVLYESGKMKGKPKCKVKHHRKKVNLNLYLKANPRTPIERQYNKETLLLAKKIRQEREQEFLMQESGFNLQRKSDVDFLAFCQEYIDSYTKKDIRVVQQAVQRFKDFLHDTPEYKTFENKVKPTQITSDMILAFVDYLNSRSKGDGAKSIFKRFKKVFKSCALKCNINHQRPFMDSEGKSISIITDEGAIVKDFLSPEEIKKLIDTHCPQENPDTRNAFIFCLFTGMRFCDVRDLTFDNIDLANGLLTYEQNKTKGHSKHSTVTLPLADALIEIIKDKNEKAKKSDLVFHLPSHTMCLKALKRWVKKAEIDKHITWHCARHSFGTNMAAQKGVSIRTVQEMMGHSSLQYTERYTRVVDEQKKTAMDALSKLIE